MSEDKPSPQPLATFLRAGATPVPDPHAAASAQPSEDSTPAPVDDADVGVDVETPHAEAPAELQGEDAATSGQVADPVTVEPQPAPPQGDPREAAPSFMQPARTSAVRRRVPGWQWGVVAALTALLGLQLVLADRARLANDAGWRPLLGGLCTALRCSLPPWHEPQAFTMLTREVRPQPGRAGVLRIQASFRNDARWAQPWPWLQLSLSDADGRVIGSRVFAPHEYLGHAVAASETLAPGQSTQVEFHVREPAASTAAFTFDFR